MSDLGDRMKGYESVTHFHLSRRIPVIVRVDGKSFHSIPLNKPFDVEFMDDMVRMAVSVAEELQGFVFGYTQSDEVSFLLDDTKELNSEPHFGYDIQKIASTTAALATDRFNRPGRLFDARAFNIPKEEVANYFLWRKRDWARNSLQMYARSFFSQKQLHGRGREDMHEMIHAVGGASWANLSDREKNGTAFNRKAHFSSVLPGYDEIAGSISEAYLIAGWSYD